MKYMLLIQQGDTPVPGSPEWEALSDGDSVKDPYPDRQPLHR